MHDFGVRAAAVVAFIVARIALVGGVIPELLHGVDRVLRSQRRVARAGLPRPTGPWQARQAGMARARSPPRYSFSPACQYDGSAPGPPESAAKNTPRDPACPGR